MEVPKKQVKLMDLGLTFEAIGKSQVDVAMCFATDGKIPKFDLVVLEDDQQFFPVYNLSFSVRQEVLEEYPELKGILEPLAEELTDSVMQQLNYEVDVEGKPEDMVAREFLKERGFIQ
jgi:osmoprotectant transport system substrate-binding protein